jgi:hypothetical protein
VLSGENLRRFGEDGYLVVPGVVPEHLLSLLDAEIDALIAADPPPPSTVGKHFWFLPPAPLPGHAERWEDTFLDPFTEYTPVLRWLPREGDSDE